VFKKWLPRTIKQAKHHRWLSHNQVITSIARSYKSLVGDLESSEIGKDPVGNGLSKSIKDSSYNNVSRCVDFDP
jgi:hypothetical protein